MKKKRHHKSKEQIPGARKVGGGRAWKARLKSFFLEFFWQELASVIWIKMLEDRHTLKAKWKNWVTLGGK